MKAGDEITIYRDPLTEQDYEGRVQLVKFISDYGHWHGRKLVYWRVQFLHEAITYNRYILIPEGDEQ